MLARRPRIGLALVLTSVGFGLVFLLPRLSGDERRNRARLGAPPNEPLDELRAPTPVGATPLTFAWPPQGRVRVRVRSEHAQGWTTVPESFELEWRTLAEGALFVEAFAPLDADRAPPGTTHTGGTLTTPVQAVIARDGRFLRTPAFDDLRRAWDRTGGHPAGMAVPEPLAACWRDWVERWLDVALLPGEQTILADVPDGERRTLRCSALDAEGARLEYVCTRAPRRFVAQAPGVVELVDLTVEGGEVALAYENTVEVELAAGLRPRSVSTRERWTWLRSTSEVVRTVERESRTTFEWLPPALALPAEAQASAPPAWFEGWAGTRWPKLAAEARDEELAWWRTLWPALAPRCRAQLLAAARLPAHDLGTERGWRDWWLDERDGLARLWRGEDPPEATQLRLRTWLENGPPETCLDLLFVSEGYTEDDLGPEGRYWKDVERVASGLLAQAPLCWYRDWFNVRAAFLPSAERGCDRDPGHDDVRTALDVCFAAGGFELRERSPLLALARTVAEPDVVFVLVNAEPCAASSNRVERPWTVPSPLPTALVSMGCDAPARTAAHELGHAFADLADEYVDETQPAWRLYAPNFSRCDGSAPWNHFRALPGAELARWFHEGANHAAYGTFRPWPRCCMDEETEPFCPVCCEELARAIHAACALEFDDEAYHRAHPLERWPR